MDRQGKVPRTSSNEVEAANRAEATALLIRARYRVYRPEADCAGEDLVVRTPGTGGDLLPVQLKARPTVDQKRYRSIWMLFPDPKGGLGREWFLVPHNRLYDWFRRRHGHTNKWNRKWHVPYVSKELRSFLRPYLLKWGHDEGVRHE